MKHVVAVLFLLRERLENTAVAGKTVTGSDFVELVQKVSLAEYREFILAYAAKDQTFKSLFERRFADKDSHINVGDNYTIQIRRLISNSSNGDFIDDRSTPRLANEINELLGEGQQLVQRGNFRDAFVLARSVLTEVIELITYSDDSSGYIGDMINSSIELIALVAGTENVAVDLQKEMWDFLQSAIKRPIYFDYGDFGYEMVEIYQMLAIKLNEEKPFLNFVDSQIKIASEDEYSYRKEFFLVRKITFLKTIGHLGAAKELVSENLDIVAVRQGEVDDLIATKDFSPAKKLIAAGIKIAQKKNHPGTTAKWEKELLRIAVLEDDIKLVRHYTKNFAFDGGFHTNYYHQWKNTFTIAEWEAEIEKYIEERIAGITLQYQQNKGRAWYSPDTLLLDLLAPIYIEEKYWDRLLALMSNDADLDRLLRYHRYLIKLYPIQLLAIYLPAFERKGEVVGNRKQYADLVIQMEKVIEDIPDGKDDIIDLAEQLIRKYTRRPAMIEELKKLIKKRN